LSYGSAPPPPPPPPGGAAPPPPPPGGYTPPPPPSYQGAQYQPAQPQKSGGNRTLVIVLVIVGILLLLCLGCGGFCYWRGKAAIDKVGGAGGLVTSAQQSVIDDLERQRDAATDPTTKAQLQQQIDLMKSQQEQMNKAFEGK
jgi:hypothetical protein